MTGEDVILRIRNETNTVLLAFSCGKDSIASWLALRPHFKRIVPFFKISIPGMSLLEDSLRYYEDFFKTPIIRVIHPAFWRQLDLSIFQTRRTMKIIQDMYLPRPDHEDVQQQIAASVGLPADTWCGVGIRITDSPQRRISIVKYGAIRDKSRVFYPVWDWSQDRLISEIRNSGIKLPLDYQLYGRSFDGIKECYTRPLLEQRPQDFARLEQFFPLVRADIWRKRYAVQG
jgi:hypothetical protein